MSNGGACCALEICCGGDAVGRANLVKTIADATGSTEVDANNFLAWMDHEDLVFAPASMKPVIADVVAMTRKHDSSV